MKILKTVRGFSPVSSGKLKKDKWKEYDITIGLLMAGVFFISFGSYSNFTMPSLVCGIIFLLLQRYLHHNWQIPPCRRISAVLRVFAFLWLAVLISTVFGVGDDLPSLYRVRKALYVAGNYSDNRILDFMPERIPECSRYEAIFRSPMIGQDAHGYVDIRFKTDGEGIAYLRSQAESHGAEHFDYPPDETQADTEPYSKLKYYAKYRDNPNYKSVDMEVTEIYVFSWDSPIHRACYLLNAETGHVVIRW